MNNESTDKFGSQVTSIRDQSLLTPPISPASSEDVPFVPAIDDNTSLSMKRRHEIRRRRLDNRTCLSNNDLTWSPPEVKESIHKLGHIRSSPDLHRSRLQPIPRARNGSKQAYTKSSDKRQRRWTLPSKAAATNSVAHKVTVESTTSSRSRRSATVNLSPAMITLRRATTMKPESRRMSLTFFPEPKFEHTRSGLLKSFIDTISKVGTWQEPVSPAGNTDQFATPHSTRKLSIEDNQAHPPSCESAPAVCTEVTGVIPIISTPAQEQSESPIRRCSTRYVANGSVYEVIWDENVSTSGSERSNSTPGLTTSTRRKSLAVHHLEKQLFKAEAQSRRTSQAAEEQRRQSSGAASRQGSKTSSLKSYLSNKCSSFLGDATLPIPVSSHWREANPFSPSTIGTQHGESKCRVEVFPPPRSNATTGSSQKSVDLGVAGSHSNDDTQHEYTTCERNLPRNSIGSMIGVSTHARRKSAGPDVWHSRHRSHAFLSSRRASANVEPVRRTTVEDETTPLLGTVGMLE